MEQKPKPKIEDAFKELIKGLTELSDATIDISLNAILYEFDALGYQIILINSSEGNNRTDGDFHKETSVWKDRQSRIVRINEVVWDYFYSVGISRKRRL